MTNGFADDIQLTDPSYRLCGYMTENGFVYNPLNPDLWLVLSCVALCLIAAGIVIYVKRREEIDRLKLIKKQKFFLFKDIFVYAVTAVAVVVLFVAFVFTSVSTTLEKIAVFYKTPKFRFSNFQESLSFLKIQNNDQQAYMPLFGLLFSYS